MRKPEQPTSPTNKWAERLRGRTRMAVAAIGGMFILGFVCVSRPLSQRIDAAHTRLGKAVERMQLAGDVGDLRHQASQFGKKLERGVDLNDWTNYLLGGIRMQHVKLVRMEPKKLAPLGPCKVLTWHIDIVGDFQSLARVVAWIENGQRLVRIDKLSMQSRGGVLTMSMVLRGLVLDVPLAKEATSRPAGGAAIVTVEHPEPKP